MTPPDPQISIKSHEDCRVAFQQAFPLYRARLKELKKTGIAFVAFAGLVILMPLGSIFRIIALAGAVLALALSLVCVIMVDRLRCPACKKNPTNGFKSFCPQCGAGGIKPAGLFSPAQCAACGVQLMYGRGGVRSFKIRYCTYCSAHLDDTGF